MTTEKMSFRAWKNYYLANSKAELEAMVAQLEKEHKVDGKEIFESICKEEYAEYCKRFRVQKDSTDKC